MRQTHRERERTGRAHGARAPVNSLNSVRSGRDSPLATPARQPLRREGPPATAHARHGSATHVTPARQGRACPSTPRPPELEAVRADRTAGERALGAPMRRVTARTGSAALGSVLCGQPHARRHSLERTPQGREHVHVQKTAEAFRAARHTPETARTPRPAGKAGHGALIPVLCILCVKPGPGQSSRQRKPKPWSALRPGRWARAGELPGSVGLSPFSTQPVVARVCPLCENCQVCVRDSWAFLTRAETSF